MVQSLAAVRDRAGTSLFLRVAGPDGLASRERIHGTPGPRWFPPGSAIRTVHGDASMFVGGMRALLLQSLHPAAMAAVAAHSGYRGDPWGRLARTSTFLAVTTFGTIDDATAAIDRVRWVHERIRGVTPEGLEYFAGDPTLLRWVHVAEVDSFLRAHRVYGQRPLDAAGADEYVAQASRVASRSAPSGCRSRWPSWRRRWTEFRPALGPSTAAREAADFLLHEPPVPRALRPGLHAAGAGGRRLDAAVVVRAARPATGRAVSGSRRRAGGAGRWRRARSAGCSVPTTPAGCRASR